MHFNAKILLLFVHFTKTAEAMIRIVHKYSFKSGESSRGQKVYAVDLAFAAGRSGVLTTENIGWKLENLILLELLGTFPTSPMRMPSSRDSSSLFMFLNEPILAKCWRTKPF